MMHDFLMNNREELIERCRLKVLQRPRRGATREQLANGIPLFLDQLTRTLRAEQLDETDESRRISGPSGGGLPMQSEMGVSAALHAKDLLRLGFSVDQVVHDYGDLCQAITDLAFEREAPFEIDEFRTLNRCLDNAIADAVTEFSSQHDFEVADKHLADAAQRVGFLVHELRNLLSAATLAFSALETGKLTIGGATGGVLKRSLKGLALLIDHALLEVKATTRSPACNAIVPLAAFIEQLAQTARLEAKARGCNFVVPKVDPALAIEIDPALMSSALTNLLQNAFKFTHARTEVSLRAYAAGDRIIIDVADHCGGLPPGDAEKMFLPFVQRAENRSGLGLGLSIARMNVESAGGMLSVRDVPGTGCVFTVNLPRLSVATA